MVKSENQLGHITQGRGSKFMTNSKVTLGIFLTIFFIASCSSVQKSSETISDEVEGDKTYSASMYGSCAGSDTMNFDSITKDNCVACVLENQNTTEADMQTNLSAQIEEKKTPALTSKTKEW